MLEITSEIVMDLQRPGAPSIVHAKQGEKYTRAVKIKLYNGGAAWTPPDAASCWISYCKPDGTGGTYSSYEVENGGVLQAVTISGNALIARLAPQVLTCAGMVCCEVHMKTVSAATDDLSTFSFFIDAQASAESGITSEDYWNMANTDKIVLLNAQISETANTVQSFNSALFTPMPNRDDKVLGTNGYIGTVTAANTSTVTVRATGEQWLGSAGSVSAENVGVTTPEEPSSSLELDRLKRYRSCDTVQKFIDEFLRNDLGKLIFLQDDVPPTAGEIVHADDESMYFPRQPDFGEYVVGKNGYIGQATPDDVAEYFDIVSTGWRLFDFASPKYVDDLVKLGYLDKTAEYQGQTTYDNEDEFLRSLGAGRYYVCGDGTGVWTAETHKAGNVLFSTVRNYNEYAEGGCYVYLDDQKCLSVNRDDHGRYTFNRGDIGFFNNATLSVKTPYNDYGGGIKAVANKEYVDARARFGYIDMTKAAIDDGVASTGDVVDYLMSLGAGRWAFNSDLEQNVEDWQYAVFVECITYAQCKHWTVRQFDDEGTQYIQMYEQYGDNERNTVLDIESTCGSEFSGLRIDYMNVNTLHVNKLPTYPTEAANKKYVDDAIAGVSSESYTDKTAEFAAKVASDGQTAALNWIRTLSTGKYKFTANIYGDANAELHLLDNIDVPFEMDGQTYYQRHCTEQVYDTNGNRGVIMFAGGNEVYKLFHNGGTSIGAVQGLSGTIKDYVNSRIPAKYGSAGLVLTLKEDSTAEWKELLPAYSSADAGKVLKVAEDGTLYWGTDNKGGITAESGTMI